jgi:hypothetical protein
MVNGTDSTNIEVARQRLRYRALVTHRDVVLLHDAEQLCKPKGYAIDQK